MNLKGLEGWEGSGGDHTYRWPGLGFLEPEWSCSHAVNGSWVLRGLRNARWPPGRSRQAVMRLPTCLRAPGASWRMGGKEERK